MVYKKVFKREDYNIQPFVLQWALTLTALCRETESSPKSALPEQTCTVPAKHCWCCVCSEQLFLAGTEML